jgi:hypothetical protein
MKRVYVDLDDGVADTLRDMAHEARIPKKRLLEGMIEKAAKDFQSKKTPATKKAAKQ